MSKTTPHLLYQDAFLRVKTLALLLEVVQSLLQAEEIAVCRNSEFLLCLAQLVLIPATAYQLVLSTSRSYVDSYTYIVFVP